jgi:hypothetical protein
MVVGTQCTPCPCCQHPSCSITSCSSVGSEALNQPSPIKSSRQLSGSSCNVSFAEQSCAEKYRKIYTHSCLAGAGGPRPSRPHVTHSTFPFLHGCVAVNPSPAGQAQLFVYGYFVPCLKLSHNCCRTSLRCPLRSPGTRTSSTTMLTVTCMGG